MERVAAWGVENAVGFDFKTLLQELAQENLEEYTKTFFQEGIQDWRGLGKQEQLENALGQALREFLLLVQQELEDADCSEEERQQYAESLRQFLHDKTILVELGKPFRDVVLKTDLTPPAPLPYQGRGELDSHLLAGEGQGERSAAQYCDADKLEHTWQELNLLGLPDEFNWKRIAKRYKKKADAILRESKELLAILSDEATAEVASDSDLIGYRKAIEQTYGYLKLDTLHTSGYSYRLQLLNIFVAQDVREVKEALPQLFELPKEHLERLIKTGDLELPPEVLESFRKTDQFDAEAIKEILERYKQSYAQETARSVSELIEDGQTYPYLVILGDPGSGKSSLVQYIALQWASSSIDDESFLPLPLLIELRRYVQSRDKQKCQNFVEFCQQGHGFIYPLHPQQLNERLRTGKVFVLFDGLDEVFEASKREEVITEIIRFTQDYTQVRVLVTSRVIGYQPQRLRDEKFRHFILQDLEAEQIEEFLTRWHELAFGAGEEAQLLHYPPNPPYQGGNQSWKLASPLTKGGLRGVNNDSSARSEEGKKKQERLQQAIEESPAIRQLAGNPLLLTMMAILNRNQELPRSRAALYSQASKVLLQQWDVERALIQRDAITIDFKDKQAMLRRVAYQMQGNDKGLAGNLINAENLEGILTGYLEKNLDIRDAGANAKSIVKQLRERNFILCFLGADYYGFVHRTFLEYFCAWEFVWRFQKERELLLEELKTKVFGKHWQDESWHEVLRLIAGMIDTRFVIEIIDYLMAQKGETQSFSNLFLAAKCLSEVRNQAAITSTSAKLFKQLQGLTGYGRIITLFTFYEAFEHNNRVAKIRTQAVTAVATIWKDAPDTLTWLKQRATADGNYDVRRTAVQELARGWKAHPDTLTWLKQRATADGNYDVRIAAVQELARGWKAHPDTLTWLKQQVTADDNYDVRIAAVQELARGWKAHPDTLAILKQRATTDDNCDVRRAAIQELARGWKAHPDTLTWLKQRAATDVNYDVRRAAIQELARGWKDQAGMLEFLCNCAVNDPFNDEYSFQDTPRQTALETVIKLFPDHPQTLLLLQDRAKNDPDKQVRYFAKKKLKNWS